MGVEGKKVKYLVVDTTAFIQNAPLHEITETPITCQEVVDEITDRRQLRRLVTLPYDLEIKQVFSESIKIVTEFSIKTGDYPSLSATDIKVMALTYQLEKEKVGTEHLRTEPLFQRTVNVITKPCVDDEQRVNLPGFWMPDADDRSENLDDTNLENKLSVEKDILENKQEITEDEILARISENSEDTQDLSSDDDDDDDGWITPANVKIAKKQFNSDIVEEKNVTVACMTTDFAMQNVLRQMNLNVTTIDGKMIKQLRTFILRCYTCFKTTSIMTNRFCPKCGNDTLKKVAVSLNEDGKMQIHINARKPLSGRGKKFSLPRIKGGKHPNNPILVADQPMPHNRPTKLGKTKTNALDEDYIAGFSPFAVRDVTSKAAQLKIRPGTEMKYFMRKNPNEVRRKKK